MNEKKKKRFCSDLEKIKVKNKFEKKMLKRIKKKNTKMNTKMNERTKRNKGILSIFGLIAYSLGAMNTKKLKLRALNPLTWFVFIFTMVFYFFYCAFSENSFIKGMNELFKKETFCIW